MTGPKVGSLFAGFDGIFLGLRQIWPDAEHAWTVENDPAPSRILAHHWDAPNYGDVTAVDWSAVEPVDILTGGFPCQDLSHAGKRAGLRPGTRSGLWEHMAYAIDQLRPPLVVIENVRGLLSASAASDLESCPWCVGGSSDGEPALRALGSVLGDLAELGYDAEWVGVRAADAGAPHGRFRVFIVAHPADTDLAGLEGRAAVRQRAGEQPARPDGMGPDGVVLLPTPKASDGPNGGPGMRNGRGEADSLPGVVSLLATPNAAGNTKSRRAMTSSKAGDGNGRRTGGGMSSPLGLEETASLLAGVVPDHLPLGDLPPASQAIVDALLPTPTAQAAKHAADDRGPGSLDDFNLWSVATRLGDPDGHSAEARPDQALPDVRGADDPQAVRQAARGHEPVPVTEDVRPGLWGDADGGRTAGAPLEGAAASRDDVPGVRDDHGPARPPHRPRPDEQRPGQPDDAVRVLPSAPALAGGSSAEACGCAPWGPYAPAIHRWEGVLGRPAPSPTQPGKDGRPRLNAAAVEFMMGLPAGHVTDPAIGLSRAQALRALGNGVVPQQAALALRMLLGLGVAQTLPTLATPRVGGMVNGPSQAEIDAGDPKTRLEVQVMLLKTPTAQLAINGGGQHPDKRKSGGHGPTLADEVEHLLPTPAVNDMGEGKTPADWDQWTDRMKAAHGNGNGHGKSLAIEAMRLGDL